MEHGWARADDAGELPLALSNDQVRDSKTKGLSVKTVWWHSCYLVFVDSFWKRTELTLMRYFFPHHQRADGGHDAVV